MLYRGVLLNVTVTFLFFVYFLLYNIVLVLPYINMHQYGMQEEREDL